MFALPPGWPECNRLFCCARYTPAMAYAVPQTIGDDLLDRVVALINGDDQVDPFTLKSLKRDADKLQKVDAVRGSLVKSAIASLEWDRDEALRWSNNMLMLEDNATTCFNAAISLRNSNDLKSAADFALRSYKHAPKNSTFAHHSAKMLEMAGRIKEANSILQSIKETNSETEEDFYASNQMIDAMKDIGIEEDQLINEIFIASELAAEKKIRIDFVAQGYEYDPNDGEGMYFVAIKVSVDFQKILELEELLALRLSESERWSPLKLSVEFHVND